MFSSRNFPDVFAFLDDGIANQTMATGTTSGSPFQVGGGAAGPPFRKYGHIVQGASGSTSAGSVTFAIYTATASNGSYASFSTVALGSPCSASIAPSAAGKWFLYTETRGEMFGDLNNAFWFKPVFIVTGVPVPLSLTTLGFVSGSEPASAFNSSTLGGFVTNYLM